VVVRKGRGLDVAERIERPDAPDDGARPAALLGEDDKVKLVERFAELLRQEQAAGHTLL
jgi:hypothetical protein